jgi:general secretion pathway protein G
MRRGFTLIELMVVIVILGLLVGLLLPAVMNARSATNAAADAAQIRSLSQALADFKTKYGAYPPSRIVVAEDGDYSDANLTLAVDADGIAVGPLLKPRTLSYLRRFWPRLTILTNGQKPSIPGGWYDVNGNNSLDKPYVLQGHECLALFLGGIPLKGEKGLGMTGFDKNPANPFTSAAQPPANNPWPFGTNRTPPYYDGPVKPAINGVAFLDHNRTNFYAYFSAYEGGGFDPDDVNLPETDDDSGLVVLGAVQTTNAATPKGNGQRKDIVSSPAPNPYSNDAPMPITSGGALNLTELRRRVNWKDQSFQIISAGEDGKFGIGGQYVPDESVTLPFYAAATKSITGQTLTVSVRNSEKDNVSNFSAGRLR